MKGDEHVQQYRQRGWLVIENVFSPDEADMIARLAEEISLGDLGQEDSATAITDRGAEGQLLPRKIMQPFLRHPTFRAFVLDQRLQRLVSRLLGGEPLLCTDQIFMKPPRFGSAKPYHQDNYYFRCHPPDQVLTAWIALDDVDEENGCLRYIDGSHREGIKPHSPVPGERHNLAVDDKHIDLDRESLAIVGRGGVVFHHSETLHTSHRNESDRWRRGYATHWITPGVTSEGDVVANGYFHDTYQI